MDAYALEAIEAIKALRGRFARTMDTKDWNGLRDCISKDCVFDCTQEAGVDAPWLGVDEIVGNIRRSFNTATTVHHAHTPEIEVISKTAARGVWAMQDMLRFPGVPTVELTGYGHYHEEYERTDDGRWRLKKYRLTRLRSDVAQHYPAGFEATTPPRAFHPQRKINAVLLHAYGGPEVLHLEEVPEPLPADGEVAIRVAGAAVNPVDLKLRAGAFALFMPLAFPAQLGGDVTGTIEAIGAGVEGFAVGDRVMGMINPSLNGAYAEIVIAPASLITKVPTALDLAEAAAIPMSALTGWQLVTLGLRPTRGSRVLVTGATGAVGRAAVYAAADAGAEVYAGVRLGREAEVADLPIAGAVDINDLAAVKALGPLDGIADTVGGLTVERLAPLMKPGGVIASAVSPPPVPDAEHNIKVAPIWVSFDAPTLSAYAARVAKGEFKAPIAGKFPMADAAEAHRMASKPGLKGKIILLPR